MIENVSDTALWVAVYRAHETLRSDALFHDPFAERLAGSKGAAIAVQAAGGKMTEWSVVIRTYIIDRFIRQLLGKGVDTVVNLGAGLDTRPYRMNIPSHVRWIEVDYPNIVDYKEHRLSSERPTCNLERVRLDLADLTSRRTFLDALSAASQNIVILTEGVIPYLTPEQVSSLATDLRQTKGIRYWILDYQAPKLQKYVVRRRSRGQTKNAPLQFFIPDWFGFFERLEWHVQDIQYLADVSHELGRTVPLLDRADHDVDDERSSIPKALGLCGAHPTVSRVAGECEQLEQFPLVLQYVVMLLLALGRCGWSQPIRWDLRSRVLRTQTRDRRKTAPCLTHSVSLRPITRQRSLTIRSSPIFLRRIVCSMFMRVNSKCAHQ